MLVDEQGDPAPDIEVCDHSEFPIGLVDQAAT
jgi:hypothetical protein